MQLDEFIQTFQGNLFTRCFTLPSPADNEPGLWLLVGEYRNGEYEVLTTLEGYARRFESADAALKVAREIGFYMVVVSFPSEDFAKQGFRFH